MKVDPARWAQQRERLQRERDELAPKVGQAEQAYSEAFTSCLSSQDDYAANLIRRIWAIPPVLGAGAGVGLALSLNFGAPPVVSYVAGLGTSCLATIGAAMGLGWLDDHPAACRDKQRWSTRWIERQERLSQLEAEIKAIDETVREIKEEIGVNLYPGDAPNIEEHQDFLLVGDHLLDREE